MTRARPGRGRKTLPAALLVAGCSAPQVIDAGTDAGTDAGYDAGTTDAGLDCTERIVDGGQKCGCLQQYNPSTMMFEPFGYCDPDVGNPCPLGCANPKKPDGGREYQDEDAGIPQCLC